MIFFPPESWPKFSNLPFSTKWKQFARWECDPFKWHVVGQSQIFQSKMMHHILIALSMRKINL